MRRGKYSLSVFHPTPVIRLFFSKTNIFHSFFFLILLFNYRQYYIMSIYTKNSPQYQEIHLNVSWMIRGTTIASFDFLTITIVTPQTHFAVYCLNWITNICTAKCKRFSSNGYLNNRVIIYIYLIEWIMVIMFLDIGWCCIFGYDKITVMLMVLKQYLWIA